MAHHFHINFFFILIKNNIERIVPKKDAIQKEKLNVDFMAKKVAMNIFITIFLEFCFFFTKIWLWDIWKFN
jgi:hypothetical protein